VQVPIKHRLRATPPTLVRDAELLDEVDRPLSVREISGELYVSTPLTPTHGHLLCLHPRVVRKRSASCSTAQSCAFFARFMPEYPVHGNMVTESIQAQDFSAIKDGSDCTQGWFRVPNRYSYLQRLCSLHLRVLALSQTSMFPHFTLRGIKIISRTITSASH